MILPSFQRTHVTSNAVGLLLHYALDLPVDGGLGLRRAVWQANVFNEASVRSAERMGFKLEAVLRWDRVLPIDKDDARNKKGERNGDPRAGCVGRDTAMLSICWDDWESGGKEHVDSIMDRLE
jgi:RimJ/RimL family protein N-acetyltransferase